MAKFNFSLNAYSNIAAMNRSFQFVAPYIAIISFVVLAISVYKRNDFSTTLKPLPALSQEPKQTPINQDPFETTYNNETFKIMPRFEYEIYGLVVSYRLHNANGTSMLHDLNKDHLNVADFCVVWGESADPHLLKNMDFSSGQFTCNYSSSSRQIWESFKHEKLSNNHLLATDEMIRNQIDQVRIGDQIYIKGRLAHYTNPLGFERRTSTVRTDKGNGACETLLVDEIQIIKSMGSQWRNLIWLALLSLCVALWVIYHTPINADQFGKNNS